MLSDIDIPAVFNSPFGTSKGPADLVSVILWNSFVVAGIIMLFLILMGGIGIISGAGSGNSDQTGKGKKAITSALIGFAIIFTSYWIIQVIEILTGTNILSPTI